MSNLVTAEILKNVMLDGSFQNRPDKFTQLSQLTVEETIDIFDIALQTNQETILDILLANQKITHEIMNTAKIKSRFCQLASDQNFTVIKKFVKHDLFTSETLKAQSPEGASLAFMLVYYKQFEIFEECLRRNMIAPEVYTQQYRGINVLWTLAFYKQFDLICDAIDNEEIDKEAFSFRVGGINTIWLLAKNKEFILIDDIFSQGLIDSEMLSTTPLQRKALTLIQLLIEENEWGLIERIITENLLTKAILCDVLCLAIKHDKKYFIDLLLGNPLFNKELFFLHMKTQDIPLSKLFMILIIREDFDFIQTILKGNYFLKQDLINALNRRVVECLEHHGYRVLCKYPDNQLFLKSEMDKKNKNNFSFELVPKQKSEAQLLNKRERQISDNTMPPPKRARFFKNSALFRSDKHCIRDSMNQVP